MIFSNNQVYSLDDIIKKVKGKVYKTLYDFQQDVFKISTTAKDVELFMPIMNCNIIKLDRENEASKGKYFCDAMFKIKLENIEQYILMASEADVHLFSPEGVIIAIYTSFEEFPIARFYTYHTQNKKDVDLIADLVINKKYPYNTCLYRLDELIDKKNSEKRIEKYLKNAENLFEKAEKYVKGRIDNTSITGGLLMAKKDNTCLICNNPESNACELEKVSVVNFNYGIEIVMNVF